jgi:hypothetical protein
VLAVHYRGSWGVPGGFSIQHAIEDADAEVEWLRSDAIAARYHKLHHVVGRFNRQVRIYKARQHLRLASGHERRH